MVLRRVMGRYATARRASRAPGLGRGVIEPTWKPTGSTPERPTAVRRRANKGTHKLSPTRQSSYGMWSGPGEEAEEAERKAERTSSSVMVALPAASASAGGMGHTEPAARSARSAASTASWASREEQ